MTELHLLSIAEREEFFEAAALAEQELLDRVAIHKSIYFASAWASYGTARKGSLKLLPPLSIYDDLERDYGLMKDMFFGGVPGWSEILKIIRDFEVDFNKRKSQV